jgi:hypothetical protein
MKIPSWHLPALFTVAGLSVASAHDLSTSVLDETVIIGKRTDLLGIAGAATEASTGGDELRARPLLRRGEALEAVPGMVVTQHAGGGKANQYFLRGFNLDHGTDFAISIDGMPVNMRTHAHGQGYADLNILIPELVERLDYDKGTYTARNGDLSSAGSADFKLYDILPRGFATLEVGEHNYWRGVIGDTIALGADDTGKDATKLAPRLTFAGEFTYYNGPWDLPEEFTRWNGFLRYFDGDENNHFALTFMGNHSDWQSSDQIPRRAIESGRLGRFGNLDDTNGGDSQRYSLQLHWQSRVGDTTTRLGLYGVYYDLNLFSNFTYFLDDPDRGDQFEQSERRFLYGSEMSRTWGGLEFLGKEAEITVGLETRSDFIDGIGLYKTDRRERFRTVREDEVLESSAGVFAESSVRWTPWLRTVVGVRGDAFLFDVDADSRGNSGDDWSGIVSPKFTAILGPWAKTEFYLNFGTGFHSNDARGVNTTRDPETGDPVPPVDPLVRTIGAEIGLRTQLVPTVTATLAAWWLQSDSELVYVGDAGTNEPGPGSRRYGVEAAVYWAPTEWLTVDAEFAATHARFDDAGDADRIPDSIPWMFSGGFVLGAQAQEPGWFAGARARAFARRPLIEDNSVKGRETFSLNANLGYRAAAWEAAVECLNVLDRDDNDIEYFYASRLRGERDEGFDDVHLHPAEPRMFRARFTYRW